MPELYSNSGKNTMGSLCIPIRFSPECAFYIEGRIMDASIDGARTVDT